jgi:hypothetical protein
MERLFCDVSKGLRDAEASITVHEYDGTPQYFPLDRGLVAKIRKRDTVPVRLLWADLDKKTAFVTLPVQADSGASRIWVPLDNLIQPDDVVQREAVG